jgi:lantibiotic biosynthesis protein
VVALSACVKEGKMPTLTIEIPEKLKDPTSVENLMMDSTQYNPDLLFPGVPFWNSLSLSNGLPGILLLFSTLESQGLLELNDKDIVHRYVLKIKKSIETDGIGKDLSLFSGLAGLCFALQSASMEGKRYHRFLNTLQTHLLKKIEFVYLEPINENIQSGKPSSSTLHDVIQGLSGIGRYALKNLSDPRFEEISIKIVRTLVDYTRPLSIEKEQVPGWYLASNDILNIYRRSPLPHGNFNLGLAHGVPGILSFLSIALLKGLEVEGQKESIATIANWIKEKSFLEKNHIRWAHNISWEEEVLGQNNPHKKGCRDAWCYGTPGVSRSLFLAACALKDQKMKAFASQAFRDIFNRSLQEWFLPGPAICHGISGLLLITDQMAQEEGLEDLFAEADKLEQLLISFYQPEFPFGFKDSETRLNGESIELNKPGLLEGAAGIFLVLATLKNPKRKWHLPFLIHA